MWLVIFWQPAIVRWNWPKPGQQSYQDPASECGLIVGAWRSKSVSQDRSGLLRQARCALFRSAVCAWCPLHARIHTEGVRETRNVEEESTSAVSFESLC